MPIFIAALLGGLVQASASIAGRVLIALGIGYVTYQGIDLLLDSLKSQIVGLLTSVPPQFVQVLSTLKIDVAISITFSAIAARLVLQGLTSGALTKMVVK